MENSHLHKCDRPGEIVSYIYKELDIDARNEFEAHLAGCSICTDQFAELAYARFSVFEWHKEEFLDLPTPQFTIPYEQRSASASILSGFVGALRGVRWAIPAVALILVFLGTAYFLTNNFSGGGGTPTTVESVQLAGNEIPGTSISNTEPILVDQEDTAPNEQMTLNVSESRKSLSTLKAKSRSKAKPLPVRISKPSSPDRDKPVLSSYREVEDRSLRLSDLFEEVGG